MTNVGAKMINRNLMMVEQEWVKSFIRVGMLALAILSLVAIASSVRAQTFDQAVKDACDASGICQGTPGASGGSTTALSNESSPVPERKIEKLMGPWNLYFAGDYERFRKSVTKFEPGYKNNIWYAAVGADYALNNVMLLGGAVRYVHDDGDFKGGGNFDTDSYGFLLHSNYVPAPGWFLDTHAGYMRRNYSINRAVSLDTGVTDTLKGKPDGNEYKVGVNGGYDFNFQNITVGPRLGLNYKRTNIDGYRERGRAAVTITGLELDYDNQHENSLTSVLGLHASIAISTSIGVLVPQAAAEYVHEFQDPQRRIKFRLAGDPSAGKFTFNNDRPDQNYFNLGGGIALQLPRGIAPFINYRALVGYHEQSSHRVTAGLRIEF